MKTIQLPYTPSITADTVLEMLKREYPSKKAYKLFNFVRINENAFRSATVTVSHNVRNNLTTIAVAAALPIWGGATIIIPILAAALFTYVLAGNWATDLHASLSRAFNTSRY